MKRTRRVEIIRYSRSTVITNEFAVEQDMTAERAAIDVLLGIPQTSEPPIEGNGPASSPATCLDRPHTAQKGRFLRLFKWLQRRA